jgi:hypothetical protein
MESRIELRNMYEEKAHIRALEWSVEDPSCLFWVTSSGKIMLYDLRIRCPQMIRSDKSMGTLSSCLSISSFELIAGFNKNDSGNVGHFDMRQRAFVQRWNDPTLENICQIQALPTPTKTGQQAAHNFLVFGDLKHAAGTLQSPYSVVPSFSLYQKKSKGDDGGWSCSAGISGQDCNYKKDVGGYTGPTSPNLFVAVNDLLCAYVI